METDASVKADAADAKKKKVRKTDVPFVSIGTAGLTPQQLNDYFEKECQMQAADKLMVRVS